MEDSPPPPPPGPETQREMDEAEPAPLHPVTKRVLPGAQKEMTGELTLPKELRDEELRGLASSVHNPANEMEEDTEAPAALGTEIPQMQAGEGRGSDLPPVTHLSEAEHCLLRMVEIIMAPVTSHIDRMEEAMHNSLAAPITAAQPATRRGPPLLLPPRPKTGPRRLGPVPGTGSGMGSGPATWANVARGVGTTQAGMAQHQRDATFTCGAANAQGRTPAGNRTARSGAQALASSTTTEVMVIQDGGFLDTKQEQALQAQHPQTIVMEVRTAIEQQTWEPIKVLGGR